MFTRAQIDEMWARSTHMKKGPGGLMYFRDSKMEYIQEHWRFDSYEEYLGVLREIFSQRGMVEAYVEECGQQFPKFIRDKIIEEVTPAFADIPVEKIAGYYVEKEASFQLVYNDPRDLAKDFGLEKILDEIEGVDEIDEFDLEYALFVAGMRREHTLVIPVSMSLKDYYSQKKSWKTAYAGGKVDVVFGQGYCFSIPAYEINAENAKIHWKNTLDGPSSLSFEENIFAKAASIELRALIEIEIARVRKGGEQ